MTNPQPHTHPTDSYASLKKLVKERGLLERQPAFLAFKIGVNLALLALSIGFLFVTNSLWLQIPNALLMAFTFGQIGFIIHDVGHRQGFSSSRLNAFVGMLHANLLLGMGFAWWVEKHNQHHANPNQEDHDPDINLVVIALSEEEARSRHGFLRFMIQHQAIFFFPLLLLESPSLHKGSLEFLLRRTSKYRGLELLLVALHFVGFAALLLATLGFWHGLVFILVQQALFGFYMASVFAPNHKGMPLLDKDTELDFMRRQILTARNVYPHPAVDYWYGGLNYQIEHHLFPTLPRNKLREAHAIVKQFCGEQGIDYYETSMLGSYQEILQHLHQVSASLHTRAVRQPSP
jgi:fatty acid desaturase